MEKSGKNGTLAMSFKKLLLLLQLILPVNLLFMAKQAGDYFIEGTLDDLTFYKMDGVYYVRMKSSLTGKKFWKHKVFERSRESCKRFAEGNKLASKLYRHLEKEERQYKLFCFLKKRAILLLKDGKSLADAEAILNEYLVEFGYIERIVHEPKAQKREGDFSNHINADEIFQIRDLPERKITFLKNQSKVYACAVGPPKVIGI